MAITKRKKVSDHLPCKLTNEERLSKADDLAQAVQAVEQALVNKKSMLQQATADVRVAEARRERLATVVATGTEYRDVTVEVGYDYDNGKVSETRTDTGEIIKERRMTDEERQQELFDDGEKFSEDQTTEEK